MRPVTQMLRAFVWPDQYHRTPRGGEPREGKRKGKTEFEKQLEDIEAVQGALGREAWPWFGPTIILDTETHTCVGQPLRFGVSQVRGWDYRNLMEFARKYKGEVPRKVMDELRREILFYETAQCTVDEITLMREYADKHDMVFMTREDFINK